MSYRIASKHGRDTSSVTFVNLSYIVPLHNPLTLPGNLPTSWTPLNPNPTGIAIIHQQKPPIRQSTVRADPPRIPLEQVASKCTSPSPLLSPLRSHRIPHTAYRTPHRAMTAPTHPQVYPST
ncbi:hypothetical protein BP00DRAFT_431555 [Aspergillus indologenus CBS 114.80]|uniref:Uncharacterized protein n=1 Tax=Aspergillus indologenus CBS 114.80 TaxID=1450541 RepID=A0A2V5IMR0_9EURO|nr:hypothetical protein BP00DRAFT_431555 [Aspergillus indologenus CBS 114.80]